MRIIKRQAIKGVTLACAWMALPGAALAQCGGSRVAIVSTSPHGAVR